MSYPKLIRAFAIVLASSLAGMAVVLSAPPSSLSQYDVTPVTIVLKATVQIGAAEVTLRDVATLQGGDAKWRGQMGAVDLAELSTSAPSDAISRDQIAYRLRLAGFEPKQFRIEGAGPIQVSLEGQGRGTPPASANAIASTATAEDTILVKSGGSVRLIAHVGPLRLTTLGEALQEGRAGQMIRVRNVDSHNIVNGRVIDRGIVEVQY